MEKLSVKFVGLTLTNIVSVENVTIDVSFAGGELDLYSVLTISRPNGVLYVTHGAVEDSADVITVGYYIGNEHSEGDVRLIDKAFSNSLLNEAAISRIIAAFELLAN